VPHLGAGGRDVRRGDRAVSDPRREHRGTVGAARRPRRLSAAVAAACRSLAADPGRRQVALRGLARTATTADDLAWLREQAGDDVDLRWRALVREAELGGDITAESALLLARDPDPDAWIRALTVRAALPDAASKAEVWQQAGRGPYGPRQLGRPGGGGLLAPRPGRPAGSLRPALPGGDPEAAPGRNDPGDELHVPPLPAARHRPTYIERPGRRPRRRSRWSATLLERSDEVSRMLRARTGEPGRSDCARSARSPR
jgi:aminopeptidase N